MINVTKTYLPNKEKYQKYVDEIALFGSYARDEANDESDVDIAILKMNLKSGFDIIRA